MRSRRRSSSRCSGTQPLVRAPAARVRTHPDDRWSRPGHRTRDPQPLHGVEVAARTTKRAVPRDDRRPGRAPGVRRSPPVRTGPARPGRPTPARGQPPVLTASLSSAWRSDTVRPGRRTDVVTASSATGHRSEEIHREPAEHPGRAVLHRLEGSTEQCGRRAAVLGLLAPRPGRGRRGGGICRRREARSTRVWRGSLRRSSRTRSSQGHQPISGIATAPVYSARWPAAPAIGPCPFSSVGRASPW